MPPPEGEWRAGELTTFTPPECVMDEPFQWLTQDEAALLQNIPAEELPREPVELYPGPFRGDFWRDMLLPVAADEGAEIYVRIHANGYDDHGVQGALSMCPSQDNPYVSELYGESLRLSQRLLDAYCAATGFENSGVQIYDNMTGINWSRVPVTILEMGFMTNEHDDLAMADAGFQQTMAEGIADGIDGHVRGGSAVRCIVPCFFCGIEQPEQECPFPGGDADRCGKRECPAENRDQSI